MATRERRLRFRRKAACLAVASCFCGGLAQANPTSPNVVSGSATFASSGSTLTVTNSPSAIINWQSFGIGAGETVQFIQQSAASSVLNRVTGGNVSQILGTLQSNGKVFLLNPAGIVFGQGATVDVGGLVASTLNMTDADFLAGRMRFNADTATPGSVTNAGQISTPNGGFVWLLAPNVENSGIIHTPSGEAVLAAGHSVELVDSANPDQRVVVSAQSQDVNLSQLMTANSGNIFSVLNSGTVSANTAVAGEGGRIYFKSAGNIQTTALSVVEAHGDYAANGGRIQAFAAGDGLYAGLFDVTGRNGGFVETSGSYLDVNSAQIKIGALDPTGLGGTWLLDPVDIFITSAQPANCSPNATCTNSPSYMYGSTVATALASGNVVIQTSDGSITVDDTIITTGTGNLSLQAFSDITVNSEIGIAGGVTLQAGHNINIADYVSSSGSSGFVSLTAGNDLNFDFTSQFFYVAAPSSSVTLSAGHDIHLATSSAYGGDINAGTSISMTAGNDITLDFSNNSTGYLDAPSIDITANGNFSLTGDGAGFDITATATASHPNAGIDINAADIDVTASRLRSLTAENGGNASVTLTANSVGIQGSTISAISSNVLGGGAATTEIVANSGAMTLDQTTVAATSSSGLATVTAESSGDFSLIMGALRAISTAAVAANVDVSGANVTLTGNNNTAQLLAQSAGAGANVDVTATGSLTLNNGFFIDNLSGSQTTVDLRAAQNISILGGSDIAADYIRLNSADFQTQTATFGNSGSSGNLTIDNSTVLANLGLSFLGNTVAIQGNSNVESLDQLHGIAKTNLTLNNSTLQATNEMRLEIGGHLYLDNDSSIVVINPNTLYFDFPLLANNGWFLEGVANYTGPGPLGSEILVNGNFALLGQGFFVTYGLASDIIGTIVNQTFGQTSAAPYGWSSLPPPPTPDFFGYDPTRTGSSNCTGTASGAINCTTVDAGSSTTADGNSGTGTRSGSGPGVFMPGSPSDENLQNREPQECR